MELETIPGGQVGILGFHGLHDFQTGLRHIVVGGPDVVVGDLGGPLGSGKHVVKEKMGSGDHQTQDQNQQDPQDQKGDPYTFFHSDYLQNDFSDRRIARFAGAVYHILVNNQEFWERKRDPAGKGKRVKIRGCFAQTDGKQPYGSFRRDGKYADMNKCSYQHK